MFNLGVGDGNYCFPSSVKRWNSFCQELICSILSLPEVYSCQLWWIDVDEHWVMGTEIKRKENKLGGHGLSFLWTPDLYPPLSLELTHPRSLNQQKTKAIKRRWNNLMLFSEFRRAAGLAWGRGENSGRGSEQPYLSVVSHWISSVALWNLIWSQLNFVCIVLLVKQFPSWCVARQQYIMGLWYSPFLIISGEITLALNRWTASSRLAACANR